MRQVVFNPGVLAGRDKTWWTKWCSDAAAAKTTTCAEFTNIGAINSFNDRIWKRLIKKIGTMLFYDKCAYCEGPILATSFPAAEHYRPKAKVTIHDGTGKEAEVRINGIAHPGYYWLAYEWDNLLPACNQCNTKGKRNFFPVGGVYVEKPPVPTLPVDLDAVEQPLLLNPYKDNPSQHLRFGVRGTVAPLTDRGKASIKIYGLDRDHLRVERETAQKAAMLTLKDIVADLTSPPEEVGRRLAEECLRIKSGNVSYSSAIIDWVVPRFTN